MLLCQKKKLLKKSIKSNLNELSHLSATTDKQAIIESIVDSMFLDPATHRRKTGSAYCVKPNEPFFSSQNPYKLFLESVKHFGRSIEEQKQRLVKDTLNIEYTRARESKQSLKEAWQGYLG